MRSLSLAIGFRKAGYDIVFALHNQFGKQFLQQNDFSIYEIEQSEPENEALQLVKIIAENSFGIIIIDNYQINDTYFKYLKDTGASICYLDDLHLKEWKVDLLINCNINAKEKKYSFFPERKLLLGPRYSILREEFTNLPKKKISNHVKNILVMAGGTDLHTLSAKITRLVLDSTKSKDIQIRVIKGLSADTELTDIEKEFKNVKVYELPSKVSEHMIWADICISAGGTTLNELLATGTPTLSFIIAQNQELIQQYASNSGYIISAGWYMDMFEKKLVEGLQQLVDHYEIRCKLSERGQRLIDGLGTYRIINEVEKEKENGRASN